ncbi:MAG: hypothetical protein PHN80_06010 [Hespellia sp.]|nr:hypothetical protein [Hespellia sp.]
MRSRKKNSMKNALKWTWEHTKMIINVLSILYVVNWIYSAIVITVAIIQTGQFSFLDSLITETNETFRVVVGANVVKACVENVFKYNDFGGKGESYKPSEQEQSNSDEAQG